MELAWYSCWGGAASAPPLCHGARKAVGATIDFSGMRIGKYRRRVFSTITPTLLYLLSPLSRIASGLSTPLFPLLQLTSMMPMALPRTHHDYGFD